MVVVHRAKEAGAGGSTQELRLEPEVQLVRVDLHLLLEDARQEETAHEKHHQRCRISKDTNCKKGFVGYLWAKA